MYSTNFISVVGIASYNSMTMRRFSGLSHGDSDAE